MRLRRRAHPSLVLTAAALTVFGLVPAATPALAAETTPPSSPEPSASSAPPAAGVDDPGKTLGTGWKASKDRAVTSAADTDGLKILVADSSKAYAWKTVASLAEPTLTADTWIGNQCVMDAGHVAVVYAPRTFTNKPDLMQGGAFAAVVNTSTGAVVKLPFTASLAYFDPSCNTVTHTAAFTAFRDMNDPAKTKSRVVTVDTAGKTVGSAVAKGEITSAVPVEDGAIGARGDQLVHLDEKGRATTLATADSPPFDIRPTGDGHVAFLDRQGDSTARAKLWRGQGNPSVIASGKLGDMDLRQGVEGRVFLTGKPAGTRLKDTGVTLLDAPAHTEVSTLGRLAVDPVLTPGVRHGLTRIKDAGKGFAQSGSASESTTEGAPDTVADGEPTTVTSTATTTGEEITQSVAQTTADSGDTSVSPALTGTAASAGLTAADSRANDPIDTDRWCSVPRNDVNSQALQPTPNQVEWAVDMAVRYELRASRITQGGWRDQIGIGTIDPQGLFPRPTLNGTSGRIPANVLLGVMAQESNLWQAEPGSIPGQMGNPLASYAGFYGHKGDDPASYWKINWANSDCGYGVGQVTDGMRLAGHEKDGETALPASTQRAVALDYTVNVAASLYILADKWNELHESNQTITVNNDDPAKPENWFAALWNYNLGFNPRSAETQNGNWGLGWYNNPANPAYPPDRDPFMDMSVDPGNWPWDAAHPQYWPYEEKVLGWSAWSIDTGFSYATSGRQDWPGETGYSSAGFRPAWWATEADRSRIKPPLSTFCNSANNCDSDNPPDCPDADCYTQYWWHQSNVTWKDDCISTCGNENIKYQTLVSEPGRGYRLQYGTPTCAGDSANKLPSGALIVNSVADNTNTYSTCGSTGTDDGSFQFTFNNDGSVGPGLGQYEAKGDLYQIGGGYDGHFWYAHTRNSAHLGGDTGVMTVKGTWTLGQNLNGWARVFVHLPDTGAHTQQAHYTIHGVAGGDRQRYLNTHYGENTWAELGVYHFTGTPQVELTNTTDDGTADEDVAFTSVAFQSLPGKPQDMVVAMGDSYTSGEGSGDYYPVSDRDHGETSWNACRRSPNAWPRKVTLPNQTQTVAALADSYDASLDFQFVACSGAKTWQAASGSPIDSSTGKETWGFDGNFHEKLQLDSGVLSSDTTLVMLTIGGNDAQFDRKIQACVESGCPSEASMQADIDATVAKTATLLSDIHAAAPNASISLMGYPLLFSRTEACSTLVSASQRVILNDMAQYFEDKQSALAASMSAENVHYRSPQSAFEGKRICDATEGINGVVAGPNGDGDFHHDDPKTPLCWWFWGDSCLSRESYHPNKTGTSAYAQAFMTLGPASLRRENQ
ncbi:SGNH/GDSL hydrolase family protein [Streptomyces sp. NBC_00663]|uniref:SGNH/GDSL hydrolase family protein n=1 Tax=Streptomyces sp. NBC_00663 TaxID=2975801 RepID=UPI002E2F9AF7|nr:SGNH/GDSL hydrolase family protein [Streptomyces sp. NBC_00663]